MFNIDEYLAYYLLTFCDRRVVRRAPAAGFSSPGAGSSFSAAGFRFPGAGSFFPALSAPPRV